MKRPKKRRKRNQARGQGWIRYDKKHILIVSQEVKTIGGYVLGFTMEEG